MLQHLFLKEHKSTHNSHAKALAGVPIACSGGVRWFQAGAKAIGKLRLVAFLHRPYF